jgi:putative Mn2+ efflux pump MntP
MPFAVIVGIAVGLAMDAFSVAAATSVRLRPVSRRQVFRFAFHFGLFQALMPALGWGLGRSVQQFVDTWDHWVAFGLLAAVGLRAIWSALGPQDDAACAVEDPTRGWSLVALSIATSIDAMAVGLSFAFLRTGIWYPCVVIGLITAVLTVTGMLVGSHLGAKLGARVELAGGLVLILIGIKILANGSMIL